MVKLNWLSLETRFKIYRTLLDYRQGKIGLGGLIIAFITLMMAAAFASPLRSSLINSVNVTGAGLENYTGGASAVGNQIPLFWVLVMVAIVIAPVAKEFSMLD